MTQTPSQDCSQLVDLLARWRAFSELQQRAFLFLANEALASGAAFENSTEGATRVLTRMSDITDAAEVRAETWTVVHRLQAADRSRQGLEQVASVLNALQTQHADLLAQTRAATNLPDVEVMIDGWIKALCGIVTLSDWRRRLEDALHGRPPSEPEAVVDDELF